MSGLKLLGPNGSDAVTLQNTQNVTKTVDVTDVASDAYYKSRVGTGGGFSFRNKIVDGRFDFWYEGTTNITSGYGAATMWFDWHGYSTKTVTRQTLTPGVDLPSIEVPSAKYFHRTQVVSGSSNLEVASIVGRMEGVSTLAGKTVTLSFYAKADSAKNVEVRLVQSFGSGGSPSESTTTAQLVSISASWKRYSVTMTVPSISGKTLGTSGDRLEALIMYDASTTYSTLLGNQSGTFDIACVQLEEGSVATPFEELPMDVTISLSQRYFQNIPMGPYRPMLCAGTTSGYMFVQFEQEMRATPSYTWNSLSTWYNSTTQAVTASSTNVINQQSALINISVASGLANLAMAMVSGSFIRFDARL